MKKRGKEFLLVTKGEVTFLPDKKWTKSFFDQSKFLKPDLDTSLSRDFFFLDRLMVAKRGQTCEFGKGASGKIDNYCL